MPPLSVSGNGRVRIAINDLLGLQQFPKSMGRTFQNRELDPNEIETFGQNGTPSMANSWGP